MSHPASTTGRSDVDPEKATHPTPEILRRLNQIGAAINRVAPRGYVSVDTVSLKEVLRLIVDSIVDLVPDSTAALYVYDSREGRFDLSSQTLAGDPDSSASDDPPRPDGLGMRAIRRREPVFSYEEPDVPAGERGPQAGVRTIASYPLVVAHQPVGVLYVILRHAECLTSLEHLISEALASHAAMVIYQARRMSDTQRELARSEEAVDRLWHAGMLISSRLGLDETLEAILQMALDVTGAHHGIFRLVNEASTHLVARAIAGAPGRPQMGDLGIDGTSIMGWVAAHRQSLCIHDLDAAPWVQLYHPLDADLRMRSELAVPLVGAGGRLEGVLNLESPLVGAFDDQDRHLLQSLATQAVIAIQEARLLDALLEAAQLLLLAPPHDVLRRLVRQACDLLNASAGAIWLLEGEELVLQATTEGLHRGDRLPVSNSLTGQVILDGAPVTSDDVRQDARFFRPELAQRQAWTRALIVPLLASEGGEALGAFSVYGVVGEPGHFTESKWDEKVLTCLAHYATLALQNAEHQRVLRLAQERHAVAETFAAVGDVAANVLHHLNNKVGTIPVRVQAIQDKSGSALTGDPYLAANLVEIERSAREAMDAVRDSLTYLHPIHAAPVGVAECVRRALDGVALPDGVRVRLEPMDELPQVIASERSLTFVFTNLLENAAAAMAGTGEIIIRGESAGPWVEIEVADDGPGISEVYHERIFEFDAPEHGIWRGGKLGFGLWWVKTLMMRLGGTVRVESDGMHGTCFRLRLPRVEGDHA
jgi:signal transduction histidine kinase/putative methionine-R-sulfoxide reductase with GAF domain